MATIKDTKPKRLIYSPKAYVFIRSWRTGEVIDVSNDVVGGAVNRVINQPSSATIRLQNPNFRYTGRFESMFQPMDGITIWLQRIAGKPIQVFTGYIDEVPQYQMYPGNIEIRASCTLKRLLHTYFDPGLMQMIKFFGDSGWNFDPTTGQGFNRDAISSIFGGKYPDGGFGLVLRRFLQEICNWDPKAIIISELNTTMTDSLATLYNSKIAGSEENLRKWKAFMAKVMTQQPGSAEMANDNTLAPGVVADRSVIQQIVNETNKMGAGQPSDSPSRPAPNLARPTLQDIFLASVIMTKVDKDHVEDNAGKIDYGIGIFAIPQLANRPTKVDYTKIKDSIAYFFSKFDEIARNEAGVHRSREELIAMTLSIGMNKDQFYTDILEACKEEANKQIANSLAETKDITEISAEVVLTAREVANTNNDERITWEELMSSEAARVDTVNYESGGLEKNTIYKMMGELESVESSTVFPKNFDRPIKIDLRAIEYYVVERGKRPSAETGGKLGDIPVGANLRITNPKNGRSLIAMLGDYSTEDGPPIGLSPKIISSLNLTNDISRASDGSVEIYVEYLMDRDFTAEQVNDNGQLTQEAITTIKAAGYLGPGGMGTADHRFQTINDKDREVYRQHYKASNDVMAEYFFVANDMGLRLAPPWSGAEITKGWKTAIAVTPDSSSAPSRGLQRYVEWASQQIGVVEARYADNENMYEYEDGVLKRTETRDIMGANTALVRLVDNPPRPIYNGETINLLVNEDQEPENMGKEVHWQDLAKLGIGTAFTTMFSLPTNALESHILRGDRAISNDIPVINGVKQLAFGSMRNYMSLPNGQFVAFYPDHFGTFGRKPYWKMYDIEIENLSINFNDAELVTHMYVTGAVSNPTEGVGPVDRIMSLGVITIEDMIEGNFIQIPKVTPVSGPNSAGTPNSMGGTYKGTGAPDESAGLGGQFAREFENLSNSYDFLQKYGARPLRVDEPLIRSPFFEFIHAVSQFLYHWGKTHATTAQVSFQPELMAGGIVEFPDHGDLRLYTEQVTHVWDYTSGFQTQAVFSSPHSGTGSIPYIPKAFS